MAGNSHSFYMFKINFHIFERTHNDSLIYKHSQNRYIVYNKKLSWQRFLSVIQNHIAERHWVEVNSRVNYPLKAALTWMQSNSIIDLDCPVTKYCVSLMTGKLSQVGIKLHVRSWNNHRIPGE